MRGACISRAVGLVLGTGLLAPLPLASAYVHTLTPGGCNPVHWAQTCVFVSPDPVGLPDLPQRDVERIVQSAVGGWQTPAGSYLQLESLQASESREAAVDGWQTILFRSTTWCRPADSSGPALCYDSAANALTTISYVRDELDASNDGRIIDADIELNAVHAVFYDADAQPAPVDPGRRPTDLWNTLTHELGHLQGLDHTCRGRSDTMPRCARDDAGNSVVECTEVEARRDDDAALAAIHASTMYPSAKAKETSKRTPEPDDLAAVVSLYGTEHDPNVCTMPGTDFESNVAESKLAPGAEATTVSCNASPFGASEPGPLWGLALALVAVLRRRPTTRADRGQTRG